jgi:hypothetical protein
MGEYVIMDGGRIAMDDGRGGHFQAFGEYRCSEFEGLLGACMARSQGYL